MHRANGFAAILLFLAGLCHFSVASALAKTDPPLLSKTDPGMLI